MPRGRGEGALESVTAGLSAAATREEILRSMLSVGRQVLAASAAVAYLKAQGGERLGLVAHEGLPDDVAALVDVSLSSSTPVARAMSEGRPLWISSREELDRDFPDFGRAVAGSSFERRSIAALPLRVSGAIVGGIGFAFPEAHAFDQSERAFLTTLAARCEAAMERAVLYEESQRSRAEAESLLRFHEVVSGILAHDLKNPLAAILMNARILRTEESERARAIGSRIVTSGERMARMVEQILEWTRLRAGAGQIKVERAPCDLAEIVYDVVAELRARKGEVPILVETRGDLRGRWDADRLAQVVSNLVGNALDHATRPGVTIDLAADGAKVTMTVANEGEIEEKILRALFEPFHPDADGVVPRGRGRGLGLGLFITREIVLAHGGDVDVEAARPPRVVFIVTLPRA